MHAEFLCGLDYALGPAAEVVVAGRDGVARTRALLGALRKTYLPNAVVLFKPAGADSARIEKLAPFTKEIKEIDGGAAAYVCVGGRCLRPVTTAEELIRALSGIYLDAHAR